MLRHEFHTDEPFVFEAGGRLDSLSLVYYTSDRDYKPSDEVVWICHTITSNADPEDWWPSMVGKGKLFDTDKYFVICVSLICSPYGSSCPASINPATGKPYLLSFPRTTVRDTVRANILVREFLGIEKIHFLIGPSVGGFQAVEWAVIEPERIENLAMLASGVRVTPYLTAFNESQRLAILADSSYLAAESVDGGKAGLRCARSIALISYRSSEGYNRTQPERDEDTLFADRAASYQRYQGDKLLARGFDAYSYTYLSYILDSMNIGRGRGGIEAALSKIKARTLIINIESDGLFPAKTGRDAAAMIPHSEFYVISSDFGHDGLFLEPEQMEVIVKPLL